VSTVVAVRRAGIACIAADSLTTFGDQRQAPGYDRYSNKIQRVGNGAIAIVGSAAHTLVLESVVRGRRVRMDLRDRMTIFESFRALHTELKEHYFLNPKEDDQGEDPYESSRIDALVANPHGIFGIYALREVYEYSTFWAIGSGAEYALGAMYAAWADPEASAASIAHVGVAAGIEFDTGSGLPVTTREFPIRGETQRD
jgi:ATP-dependent HslUV protease, peptidase subunit HslV